LQNIDLFCRALLQKRPITYLSDISQCIESHTRKSNVSSRSLLQNIDLFCRALLQKRPIIFKKPTIY